MPRHPILSLDDYIASVDSFDVERGRFASQLVWLILPKVLLLISERLLIS